MPAERLSFPIDFRRLAVVACVLLLAFAAAPNPASGEEAGDVEARDEDALLELATKPWKGDLDGMYQRGYIRVLTVYNPLFFFYDGAEQKGIGHDITQAFAERLNKGRPKGAPPMRILQMPVARDELLPALIEGKGDIAAANLTVTEERSKLVQFSDPAYTGVSELVVTSPKAGVIASFDDLADLGLHLRESSSYFTHVTALNEKRKAEGKAEIPVTKVDENLEDYDLLEMINADLMPAIIVDSHKVAFWAKVFQGINVHQDLAVNTGGKIAWALRKDNPLLLKEVNAFWKESRKGTTLGNIILKRYLGSTKWVDNALSGDGWARYQNVISIIKTYAGKYDFDWLMV
ncbi:MAG: transporter substrate-binding domain-containing protein, partial [Kiloniellales bacterium]|nr:transporter substrate-binding domain-containing protein [Kiloniellales bacterium]